jgi:hypothetical protein
LRISQQPLMRLYRTRFPGHNIAVKRPPS